MAEKAETLNNGDSREYRWVLFVSGPTASGKTSIAKYLAEKLNLKYVEGDDVSQTMHPHLIQYLTILE